jgi:hypothetical protein
VGNDGELETLVFSNYSRAVVGFHAGDVCIAISLFDCPLLHLMLKLRQTAASHAMQGIADATVMSIVSMPYMLYTRSGWVQLMCSFSSSLVQAFVDWAHLCGVECDSCCQHMPSDLLYC